MAVGSHLSPDFVGYDVGVPNAPSPASVGFVGFLDFVGFPIGVGEAVVPPTPAPELPSFAGGGISYDEFLRRKRKKGDEEILFL